MPSNSIEILLGDNPFFGIDHLSQDRARNRMVTLDSMNKISELIEFSMQSGVKGFVVSTHPQLRELIEFLHHNSNILQKLWFYPILPYAQGYVAKVTESGVMGAINEILSGGSLQEKMKILLKGSMGLIRKDFDKLFQAFIDVELLPLANVNKQSIFLHDVVTDLAISLGMKDIIREYIDHVSKKYRTKAGFVTKNFPRFVDRLNEWKMEIPLIMTSFNPVGNQMNPSREECEKYIKQTSGNLIAMNVLAGGLIKPLEAAHYITNLNIKHVVIGMSTKQHVTETLETFGV